MKSTDILDQMLAAIRAGIYAQQQRAAAEARHAPCADVMFGLHLHPLFHLPSTTVGIALLWAGLNDARGPGLLPAVSAKEKARESHPVLATQRSRHETPRHT